MAVFLRDKASEPAACVSQTYWRARARATLDKLEHEARRMLQLENDLSEFSNRYFTAIGDAAERLAQLETQAPAAPAPEIAAALPDMLNQRDVNQQRRSELKTRYRSLAKEIHPDRTMVVEGTGQGATTMHTLNAAYQQGDLAALLRLEAQMEIERVMPLDASDTAALEAVLRDVERAAQTYADGYRALLHSPLNELMLRAMSARLAGWDWMQAVVRNMERTIEEKERALVASSIAQITAWRESVESAA